MLATRRPQREEGHAVSLSAHLTAGTAEHGRLAFHPDCPRCRAERLAGNLAADSLVSRRAQAALAAGLLAFSAGAPPRRLLRPRTPTSTRRTTTPGGEPPGLEPDFDPGGDDTFDDDTAPLPGGAEAGGSEDEGIGPPVETEPTTDPDAPTAARRASRPRHRRRPAPEPMPAPTPATPSIACHARRQSPAEPPVAELEPGSAGPPEQRRASRERKAPERSPKTHEPERRHLIGANPTPRPGSPGPVAAAVASPAPATATPVAVASPPTTAAVSQPGSPADGLISGPELHRARGRQPVVDRATAARPGGLGGPDRARGQPALGAQPGPDRHRQPQPDSRRHRAQAVTRDDTELRAGAPARARTLPRRRWWTVGRRARRRRAGGAASSGCWCPTASARRRSSSGCSAGSLRSAARTSSR